MNNKIVKALTAVVFIGFAIVLVLMMAQSIKEGVETAGQKGYIVLFAALLVYALWRAVYLIREVFRK